MSRSVIGPLPSTAFFSRAKRRRASDSPICMPYCSLRRGDGCVARRAPRAVRIEIVDDALDARVGREEPQCKAREFESVRRGLVDAVEACQQCTHDDVAASHLVATSQTMPEQCDESALPAGPQCQTQMPCSCVGR